MTRRTPKNPRASRTGAGSAVNPDNIGMFRAVTVGVLVTFASQVAISAFGLYEVGVTLGLGLVAVAVPVGIDVPILVFTAAALIFKRRGRIFARYFASTFVLVLTAVSSILNHLKAIDTVDSSTNLGQAAIVVATLAPFLIYANVEVLVMLVTKADPKPRTPSKKTRGKRAPAKRRASKPVQAPPSVDSRVPDTPALAG